MVERIGADIRNKGKVEKVTEFVEYIRKSRGSTEEDIGGDEVAGI